MKLSPREAFTELTGLHPCYDRTPTWAQKVIRDQARRIKNLSAARNAERRGYERKIRRLEAKLSALPKAPSNG